MAITGQFSQTVTIDGVAFRVRDLNLSNDSDSRVAKIRFLIDPDANRNNDMNIVSAGSQLVISQNFDGINKITSGLILTVGHSRAGNRDVLRIDGVSEEYQMQRVRFIGLWENTPADDLIADAFARFAPDFGLSIENDPTVIESLEILYDSLYDLLQQICRLTGMAWRLENGVLYYFNPIARISRTIVQPLDIEGSTADISDSLEGVYNIARMQAYDFAETFAEAMVYPGECVDTLFVDQKWAEWTLANSPIVQGVEFIDGRPEVTANWSESGEVKLSRGITTPHENKPLLIRVRLKFKRLVWVEKIDQASIDEYGVLPAPAISGNDSVGIKAAEQILDNYLAEKSQPIIKATMGLTVFDHDIDSVCQLVYPTRGIDRELFVKSFSIATNGMVTTANVELVSPADPELKLVRRNPEPVVDIEKRVTRLEKRRASLTNQQGEFAYTIGPIRFAPEVFDFWGWNEDSGIRWVPRVADQWEWGGSVSENFIPMESTVSQWEWNESISLNLSLSVDDSWSWGENVTSKMIISVLDLWGWSGSVTLSSVDSYSNSDNWNWGESLSTVTLPQESSSDSWSWSGSVSFTQILDDDLYIDSSVQLGQEQETGFTLDESVTIETAVTNQLTVDDSVTISDDSANADNSVTLTVLTVDGSILV